MKKILENSRSQYGLKVPGSCFGALLYSTLETGAILLPSDRRAVDFTLELLGSR